MSDELSPEMLEEAKPDLLTLEDEDGKEVTFGKTGKVIYLSAADIDSIMTLQCDVSN